MPTQREASTREAGRLQPRMIPPVLKWYQEDCGHQAAPVFPQINNLSPCCLSIMLASVSYMIHWEAGYVWEWYFRPTLLAGLHSSSHSFNSMDAFYWQGGNELLKWNSAAVSWLGRSLLSNLTCSYPLSQRTEQTFCEAIPFTADANARKWTICVSFWLLKQWAGCNALWSYQESYSSFVFKGHGVRLNTRSLFCFVFTLNEK